MSYTELYPSLLQNDWYFLDLWDLHLIVCLYGTTLMHIVLSTKVPPGMIYKVSML